MTTFTVDLTKAHEPDDVRALKSAAIALLWTLPDDDVNELFMRWHALTRDLEDIPPGEEVVQVRFVADGKILTDSKLEEETTPSEMEKKEGSTVAFESYEPADDAAPVAAEHDVKQKLDTIAPDDEPASFGFNKRTYKSTHRGPATAKNAALKVIAECSSLEELVSWTDAIEHLRLWLAEIGRHELEEEVRRLFMEQHSRLAAAEEDEAPQEVAEAEEVEAEEVEAEEGEADEEQLELFGEEQEPVEEVASNGAAEPDTPQLSLKDLGIAVGEKHGKEPVIALLEQYGVTKFKDLKPADVDEFRTKLEVLL